MLSNLKHRRSNGDIANDFSSYCPKCGFYRLEREVSPETDFDETGWYHLVKYKCQDSKCKHEWTEKVYV